MPPKAKQRMRYNWRARQSGHDKTRTRPDTRAGKAGLEVAGARPVSDTNAPVLPSRPAKPPREAEDRAPKRKRLGSKQKKRLMKVLEAKEKKAKRAELLSHLSGLCLPPSQMAHLLPSTSLSSPRHPHTSNMASCMEEGVGGRGGGVRGWKVRRKQRRRRELRVEKEMRAPRESGLVSAGSDQDSSEETEREEEERGREEVHGGEEEGEGEEEEEEGEEEEGGDVRAADEGGQNETAVVVETSTSIKCCSGVSVFVQLQRPVDVQEARGCLPVVGEEGRVMEVVRESPVTVLCGETGSGKTTQLPQFFYEYGYTLPSGPCGGGMIAVTEPRRVAAVSMAQRVAYEMGLSQRQVSYQIRYEGNVTAETVIKFMTDGVLLKEIEQDFLLQRYSVVIVDEAHERSVFTDILLGLLSRILPLRKKAGRPLKLVVMSATLRVNDFTRNPRLFPSPPPPIVSVESRQFPVTVHFNKRTPAAYLRAAYEKVVKIHRTLPAGHVLVFVTGRGEVLRLCRLLCSTFPGKLDPDQCRQLEEEEEEDERRERRGRNRKRRRCRVDLDKYPVLPAVGLTCEEEGGEEEEGEGEGEREREEWAADISAHDRQLPLLVLPLFSLLSSDRQAEIFKPVPEGVRLCVVATNIAETSITVPAIKYVVDCGKVKRRYYDKVTGISTFRVEWVSKASANQRAGRAGRTEPGHCYRLYSSAVFQNQFDQFSEPEICRRPVEDLLLTMKAMGIDRVANFPFPTPPSPEALQAAEKMLQGLGALSPSGKITGLGTTMAQFPVAPPYSKMLALGHQHGCLPFILTLVAALSVKELFLDSDQSLKGEDGRTERGKLKARRRSLAGSGGCRLLGDLGVLLRAVGAWDCSGRKEEFCQRHGLRPRAMKEVSKLRQQLTHTVNAVSSDMNIVIDPNLAPPTPDQVRLLRQIVLSGLGDHVARKIATDHMSLEDKKRHRHSYQCVCCEDHVYLHPSSCLLTTPPQYVVCQELMETSNRVYMRGVVAVEEVWLPLMTLQFCKFSEPLPLPLPTFDPRTGTVRCHVKVTYGPHSWPLPVQEIDHPPGLQRYRLFALFLLQGKVCPQLAQFSAALLLPPVTMVKSWANLHPQTDVLLRALVEREVCSRETLCGQWRTDNKYLLKAFSMWLPQSRHTELAEMWLPPL